MIVTVGFLEIGQQDRVTSEEMKRIEDAGAKIGISKSLMMENARFLHCTFHLSKCELPAVSWKFESLENSLCSGNRK